MQLDDQICYCFHVSKRKILNFIRRHRPSRASRISECGGAGTGCGWCIPFLQKYHAREMAAGSAQSGAGNVVEPVGPADEITPAEYASRRGEYIRQGKGVPPPGATPPPDDVPKEGEEG